MDMIEKIEFKAIKNDIISLSEEKIIVKNDQNLEIKKFHTTKEDFNSKNEENITIIENDLTRTMNLIKEGESTIERKNPKKLIKEYIGNISESQNFIIDNEFILKGYRINFHTIKKISKSACMCHNETVNIWTHFIGFILVISLILMIIFNIGPINPDNFIKKDIKNLLKKNDLILLDEVKINNTFTNLTEENFSRNSKKINGNKFLFTNSTNYDDLLEEEKTVKIPIWPVLIQLISALICLGCSTIFHLFSAYSKKLDNILNRLDYAGIAVLIAGSCFPIYYYMFACSQGNFIFFIFSPFDNLFEFDMYIFSYCFCNKPN